jgi:hypothetical protein
LATHADVIMDDGETYDTDDPWKSTSFSTQKIYSETLHTSIASVTLLVIALGISIYPFLGEQCGLGYFEYETDKF